MTPTFRDAVAHGIRHVLNFRGRDTRAWFWPYACAVLVAWLVLSNAILIPVSLIQASVGTGDPHEMLWVFLGVTAVAAFAVIMLLAAATTRRLHDRGRRGTWAAVPAVLVVTGLVLFALVAGSGDKSDPALFIAAFVNNLLYFAALIALVVQLVQGGKPGGIRFDVA